MNRPVAPSKLLEYLATREHDARADVDRLRAAIAELTVQMEHAQQLVDRLQLTQQTLLEVAGQEQDDAPGDAHLLPPGYQEVLAVFTRTDSGLRAKDVCHALNIGDRARDIENMRSKLKRLVGRDILTEPKPGLFTMNRRKR